MASPYYILNFIFILSYIPLRFLLPNNVLLAPATWLGSFFTRELQIICVVALMFFTKLRKAASWEEVLRRTITLSKFMVLAFLYLLDKRFFAMYLLVSIGLFFLPAPEVLDDEAMVTLDSGSFSLKVRNGAKDGRPWLVCFTADWCEDCSFFRGIFAKICCEYAQKDGPVSCGLVDLVEHPSLAKEFNINVTFLSRQLPTVILFHRGREIRRLPSFKADGSVVARAISYQDAVEFFELDEANPKYLRDKKKGKKRD